MNNHGITFFLEIAGPVQFVPGYFAGPFAGGRFWRVWWLWFSFGKAPVDLHGWEKLIRDRQVGWAESSLTEPNVPVETPRHGVN